MGPPGISIARPSVASLFIAMEAGGNPLSTGTAFVVQRAGTNYLVTNWHNVAGRRPDTGQPLDPSGAIPDALVVAHNVAGHLGQWDLKREPLHDADGRPLWLEHTAMPNGEADVVALPLTDIAGIDIHAHDPWNEGGLAVAVSDRVNIIGFPFGLSGGGSLGIWVQGAVATEPAIDFNDQPIMLIDSRTRPGQSGSPVIAFHTGQGAVPMAGGGIGIGGGPVERFLGVYSGRINEQSDLGFVWKPVVVREIIEHGQRPA